jgi:hypothetical protein
MRRDAAVMVNGFIPVKSTLILAKIGEDQVKNG